MYPDGQLVPRLEDDLAVLGVDNRTERAAAATALAPGTALPGVVNQEETRLHGRGRRRQVGQHPAQPTETETFEL